MTDAAKAVEAAKAKVCEEILEIMATYHEQEKSTYRIDTPGGLEHMGDVWALFSKWERMQIDAASRLTAVEEPAKVTAREFTRTIFPECYAYDTKRGGFDIVDYLDKDRTMSVGYGKTEESAWIDAASRQGFITAAAPGDVRESADHTAIPAGMMEAVSKATHYAVSDTQIRMYLEPALQWQREQALGAREDVREGVELPYMNVNGQFTNSELRTIDRFVAEANELIVDRKGLLAFIHKQRQEVLLRERQLAAALQENAELAGALSGYKNHWRVVEEILGHSPVSSRPLCSTAQKWVDRAEKAEAALVLRDEEVAQLRQIESNKGAAILDLEAELARLKGGE